MIGDQDQIIDLQRDALHYALSPRLATLARRCAPVWEKTDLLNGLLQVWLEKIPHCRLIYAVNARGVQISANVSPDEVAADRLGQDLSARPYLRAASSASDCVLSDVYISQTSGRPCITAVQAVHVNGCLAGFVAVDFDLREVPLLQTTLQPGLDWQQITGDPAIRLQMFAQPRSDSAMDLKIDDVVAIIDELMCFQGVFHAKLHFSSSRATLWLTDDPYHYRIHVLDDIIDPSVCLAYRKRDYPPAAQVDPSRIRPVLDRLVDLRIMDENLYLRSGSLNVMNGLVGLNFSCDGSHYMHYDEFLDKGIDFWMGQPAACVNS